MTEPTDVERLSGGRVDRAADCMEVKPVDLLRAMALDISTGKLDADGLVLIYINRPKEAAWDIGHYVCGLSRLEVLGLMPLIQESIIRRWRS